MSHVEITPYSHAVVKHLIDAELEFVAVALNFAEVGCGGIASEIRGNCTVGTVDDDVVTVFGKEFHCSRHKPVEKREVDTEILLESLFPV